VTITKTNDKSVDLLSSKIDPLLYLNLTHPWIRHCDFGDGSVLFIILDFYTERKRVPVTTVDLRQYSCKISANSGYAIKSAMQFLLPMHIYYVFVCYFLYFSCITTRQM